MHRVYLEGEAEGGGMVGGGKEVEKREMVKAFAYGNEYLPIDSTVENILKLEGREKGKGGGTVVDMRVLGTFPSAVVPRHHAMSNVLVLKPHKDEPVGGRAASLLLVLGQALREGGRVALVRYVRSGGADPEIGLLTPPMVWVDPEKGVGWWGEEEGREGVPWPPYLVYNKLPFLEDLRDYNFRNLSDVQGRHYPTGKEAEAGLALVDALTLPRGGRERGMALRLAPHPGIRAVYRATLEKWLNMEEEEEEGGKEGGGEGWRRGQGPVKLLSSSLKGATGLPPEMEREEGMWTKAKVRDGRKERGRGWWRILYNIADSHLPPVTPSPPSRQP